MSRKSSLIVLVCSLVVLVAVLGGAMWHQARAQSAAATRSSNPARQLGIMVEVYHYISDDYVVTPNLANVSDGALHGLVDSLDANSSYMDAAEYKRFQENQQNPPAGQVAAVISKRVGYADVVDVQPGGNAAQAGLVAGDFVEAIDNIGTRDMSLEEIHRRLQGSPGQSVTLGVVHLHHSDPVDITIAFAPRQSSRLHTSVEKGAGIIAVPDFEPGRTTQIAEAVRKLRAAGAHSFILDLRNCGAGTYAEAEHTANLFLEQGTITYLQGQKYARVTTSAEASQAVAPTAALEVLVNAGTFGPAEVAAAALQGNGRAQLIGDQTFGEGSLQKLFPVGDGSALWLSVARYHSPKGALIQNGLTPDVAQVRYAGALPDLDVRPEGVTGPLPDLQMEKALSLLATAAPAAAASAAAAGSGR